MVMVYKRVSLDDALDDNERRDLLSQLSEGAARASNSLSLLKDQDDRSQGEIATSAMNTINRYLAKQNNLHGNSKRHFQVCGFEFTRNYCIIILLSFFNPNPRGGGQKRLRSVFVV